MLTEVCNFVHNYFELEAHSGDFEIVNGVIDLPFLVVGQRFRIKGSHLNDGIYTYREEMIFDDDNLNGVVLLTENFTGTIYTMGVPKDFIGIVAEIKAWTDNNKNVIESPYTSESFGGYSYTKAVGSGANAGGVLSWQDVFRSKLNAYRKLA